MSDAILLDLDGVVIDLQTPWLARYNRQYGADISLEEWTDWDLRDWCPPGRVQWMFDQLKDPGLYDEAGAVDGALAAVKYLQSRHDVLFVTSCVDGVMAGSKIDWLRRAGLVDSRPWPAEFIATSAKGSIRGRVLLDDGVHNLEAFGSMALCFDQPWNRGYTGHRVLNWQQAVNLIDGTA